MFYRSVRTDKRKGEKDKGEIEVVKIYLKR